MSRPANGTERPSSWEWTACGASVTGSQHAAQGLGCDDAYGYGIAGDFVVGVVADGAGSVSGTSAWGSYVACQSVLSDTMAPEFIAEFRSCPAERTETLMRKLFETARGRVGQHACALSLPPGHLATTLCVAIADPRRAVFGQIGDGIIAAENGDTIGTLLIEEKSDYANATWFLQSKDAFTESFRTSVAIGVTAFALSTDGMSYKITNVGTGQAYEPFFKGSWGHVRSGASPADFAALLRGIEDDQTGDDKTMVLAALRWEADEFYPSARPLRWTVISSPPPPAQPEAGKRSEKPPTAKTVSMIKDGTRVGPESTNGIPDDEASMLGADRTPTAAEAVPRPRPGGDLVADNPPDGAGHRWRRKLGLRRKR